MIKRYTNKNLTWIDVESPTAEEARSLVEEYNIDPIIGEELTTPSFKPKIDLHEDYIYLILHFPAFKHTHKHDSNQEVDFIIGKDFIITSRYDTIDPLHKYSKMFETSSILERGDIGDHAGYIFFQMIKKLYGALIHELEYIQDSLIKIEDGIFMGEEKKMVEEISQIARNLLNLKQAIKPHREILESLDVAGKEFFGKDFSHHLKAIMNEYYKTNNRVESSREFLKELRETNDSLLSSKQNEIMKVLTIMAFVTFPLSLLASLFSMNTLSTPVVGTPGDFWLITSVMAIATAFMFGFFKYKKWL